MSPSRRFALISDIHSNIHALRAVLADIDSRADVDATYHIGDLVGYGSSPNEVVELIGERAIQGVSGNYDSTIAFDHAHCGCRASTPRDEELAHASFEWTRENTSADSKEFLAALPFGMELRSNGGHVAGPRALLLHAHPNNNLIYVDITRPDAFLAKMAETACLSDGDLVAFGHTHVPWHREVGGIHFVNTGSVGRPKDGDPRAGYTIVTAVDGGFRVEQLRVAYDVEAAAKGVVAAGLPEELADFLRHGGHKAER
jgi:predicted phosphodiesterase